MFRGGVSREPVGDRGKELFVPEVHSGERLVGHFAEESVDHVLDVMDRIGGGVVRGTWRRLHGWVEAERVAMRTPNVGEWWQWLYERMEANPAPGKAAGAYVSFKGIDHR